MAEMSRSSSLPRLSCMEVRGGSHAANSTAEMPGLDAQVYSTPYSGAESGGDVHYISSCASGRITRFLLADVSGHGPPVAGIAEDLRSIMRRHINMIDQTRLVEAVNQEFRPLHDLGTHASAIAGTYFLPRKRLTLCNAGHPSPLLYRASEKRWIVLDPVVDEASADRDGPQTAPRNIPLGIVDNATWVPRTLRFEEDDLLLLYTDCAIEAHDQNGHEIGIEGLLGLVEDVHPEHPEDLVAALVERLRIETGDQPLEDDLSLVLLRGNGLGTRFRDDLAAPFRYLGDALLTAARPLTAS